MRKTSVYLNDRESERLAWLAEREGLSQAEILRQAIAAYEPATQPDRNFEIEGCVSRADFSVADLDEEEYLKGFGE